MVDDELEKIQDEIDINLKSQTISFLLQNCNFTNDKKIISFFHENKLLNSSNKIQFIIKSLLVATFYSQNPNDFKKIIIYIINNFGKIYPDHNISYTRFLNYQINCFIIRYHVNPSLYNIHNIHNFFIPKDEFKLTFLEVIKKDNVDVLQQLVSYNLQLSQKKYQIISLNHQLGKFQELYLMDFAAYCGSIKIFKTLYLNKEAKYSDNINCFAVAGGNTEIIHICETISKNYDYCLNTSIKFHKNDIYDWLILNKNVKPDLECLLSSITYHNSILFLDMINFFFEEEDDDILLNNIHTIVEYSIRAFEPLMLQYILDNVNVSKLDDFQYETILSMKISNFPCFKILLNYFDYSGIENSPTTLFFTSIKYSNLEFAEIISDKYDKLIDYNYRDEKGQTTLHVSVILSDACKTQYLLKKCKKVNFDINIKDNSSMTPFLYAIKEGNEEIVTLFLNSKKVRITDHDQILKSIICLIMEFNFF